MHPRTKIARSYAIRLDISRILYSRLSSPRSFRKANSIEGVRTFLVALRRVFVAFCERERNANVTSDYHAHARARVRLLFPYSFGTNAARARSLLLLPFLVARRGAKSNAVFRDNVAVNYAHPSSNERRVRVIVRARDT